MGFFFTKQTKAKAVKGLRAAKASKQNADTLHRLGCSACPLDKADIHTPKMEPTLAKDTLVYFLAEAPGKDEDENSGQPLTGPTGRLLRECIPKDEERYCSFDNVVNCRPPGNRTPVWNEAECCRPRRIKWIEQAKPKLIVGLGAVPANWALGSSDLSTLRGRLYAIKVGNHECWFLPTYHPAFILRTAFDKKRPLQSKMGHCLKMDIASAFERLDKLPVPKIDTEAEARAGVQCFDGSGGLDTLLGLLKRARKAPTKAIDVETSTLRPYAANARLLTVAISFDDVNFAFAVGHPMAKWTDCEKHQIMDQLGRLLVDGTVKVAHNAPFEIEWFIEAFGPEVVNHAAWDCTMMQAHFLDERRGGQSLDFLVKQHFGIAFKGLFNLPKNDMAKSDLAECLTYNGVDTKYTLRLFHKQQQMLKDQGLLKAYYEALLRQPTVALMQHFGMAVDQKEIAASERKLEEEIAAINAEIAGLKVVQAYVKDHRVFNPQSIPDTVAIFRDYLNSKEIFEKPTQAEIHDFDRSSASKREAPPTVSVDRRVLDKIDHPLAKLIVRLRNKAKLKSTYVTCFKQGTGDFIYPDGKVHTSFNTTFTETGRLSSDAPNQQNWPKRNDSWVRKAVVPEKGHVILAFDYGQLEGCTAAVCSKDPVLVKALWEDYDIHMEWTERLVARYPLFLATAETLKNKTVAKTYRSVVKNKLVFPAIFGAANQSISSYLKVPEDVVDNIMDDFWKMFGGLKQWQNDLMKKYYNDGYVVSPTGRRHKYPLTRNQVINFPVQSVAADIVCRAMNELSALALETEQLHLHPKLNIHDDLTFTVPDDDAIIDAAVNTIYRVMLTPGYSFINVPLSVEVSIGSNWYEMEEVGKYWSHKDL